MVEHNLVEIEYENEELKRGTIETAAKEGLENHDLLVESVGWELLTRCRPPVDQIMMRHYSFSLKLF